MLQTIWVMPEQEEFARITALLPGIFPKEELPPRDITDDVLPYLCFYEDGNLIGFAQLLQKPDLLYLRYIAMLPEHRSKGYGGQMLDLILANRGTVPLALDIEPLDKHAANYEQRVRRFNFYIKHGMVDSGYIFEFGGTPFLIMSTGEETVPSIMQKYCTADKRYKPGFVRIYKKS